MRFTGRLLLLGLKGTMSEAELHVLQGRLRAGQLNKARRGEYFTHAPIGYVRSENSLVKDPDEQVRNFVEMLFSKFIELGSLSGIVRYLRDKNLTVPLRDHRGCQKGNLQWKQPNILRSCASFIILFTTVPTCMDDAGQTPEKSSKGRSIAGGFGRRAASGMC